MKWTLRGKMKDQTGSMTKFGPFTAQASRSCVVLHRREWWNTSANDPAKIKWSEILGNLKLMGSIKGKEHWFSWNWQLLLCYNFSADCCFPRQRSLHLLPKQTNKSHRSLIWPLHSSVRRHHWVHAMEERNPTWKGLINSIHINLYQGNSSYEKRFSNSISSGSPKA
jgi:hypothetical protein